MASFFIVKIKLGTFIKYYIIQLINIQCVADWLAFCIF